MKIEILTSDARHPVYAGLLIWKEKTDQQGHSVKVLAGEPDLLTGGDFLFLISCSAIVKKHVRDKFRHVIVIHASNLPEGRGWSPLVWQILEGRKEIMVTALSAEDKVDTGDIWLQKPLRLEGHELSNEIHERLNRITYDLMTDIIEKEGAIVPKKQDEQGASYYPKRTPENSRIDPEQSIASQFDLLRVADPDRYPAFFDYMGHRYQITLMKA